MARNKTTLRAYLEYLRETRTKKYRVKGFLISFDGMPGSGKDHQLSRLESEIRKQGVRVNKLRETSLVKSKERIEYMEKVREIKTEDPERSGILYTIDRKEAWEKYIIPTIQEDGIGLLDRSVYSTLVIQMLMRGIKPTDQIRSVELAELLLPEPIIPPHLAFFTICNPEIAYERAKARYENSHGVLIDYFDETYITLYSMLNEGTIGPKETMRRWWLETNSEMFRNLKKVIPESYLVTTGRKTERVNPIIYNAIPREYKSP